MAEGPDLRSDVTRLQLVEVMWGIAADGALVGAGWILLCPELLEYLRVALNSQNGCADCSYWSVFLQCCRNHHSEPCVYGSTQSLRCRDLC